jgi:hypothetical protein
MTTFVATYVFEAGETASWTISAEPAFDGTETVEALLKPATHSAGVPDRSVAIAATPLAQFVAADGSDPARWVFTLTPDQTLDLAGGLYATDARIEFDGGSVEVTRPIGIRINHSVRRP